MSINSEVLAQFARLDKSWYSNVREMFLADKGYDSTSNRIFKVITGHFQYHDQVTGQYAEDDLTIDCCMEEYAWHFDFENNIVEEDNCPVQGFIISRILLEYIAKNIVHTEELIQQDEFITKLLSIILNEINRLADIDSKSEYISVLFHFFRSFKRQVSFRYGHISRSARDQRKFGEFMNLDLSTDQVHYESDEQIIRESLKPLSGKWRKLEVMKNGDFDLLVKNTLAFTLKNGEVNDMVLKRFRTSGMPADFIRYTFNLLCELGVNGNIDKKNWAKMLKESFEVFSNTEVETIRKKMASMPLNYKTDLISTISYD